MVEHVFLLVEEAFDGEPVQRQIRVCVEPSANRLERNGEQLGVEPRARLLLPGKQNLHLLPASIDVVVPLILVVLEGRKIPDAVARGAHLVHRPKRREQLFGALCQGPLHCAERVDGRLELFVNVGPLVPVAADRRKVPFVLWGISSRVRSVPGSGLKVSATGIS